jgi:hypothetical protein
MVSKLRLTLGILLVGFVVEGTFEAYTYINHSYRLPYASYIFILGPFVTLFGLSVRWIGRFEGDVLINRRFRHAHWAFVLNILALALAIAPVVWYGSMSDASIPPWVEREFGGAIVASLLFSFATYVFVAFELAADFGKALLLIAFGWASVVSIWIGLAYARELGTIIIIFQNRTMDFGSVSASVSGFESYLGVAYILLTIAYLNAFHRSHARVPTSSSTLVARPAP